MTAPCAAGCWTGAPGRDDPAGTAPFTGIKRTVELLYDQIVIFKQLAQVLPVCKGAHLFLIFRLHAQTDKCIGHIICCQAILHGLFKIGNIFQSFAGVGGKIDPIYGKESIGKAADGIKLLFQLSVYAAQLRLSGSCRGW